MYKINNLAKRTLNKQLLTEFLDFVNEQLEIKEPYSVYFVEDKTNAKDPLGRTAMYNPSSSSVYIYATNRHPKDLLRSIAHELMHHKQKEQGKLGKMYGEGSVTEKQLELEANEAGYLVRMFEDGRKSTSTTKIDEVADRLKTSSPVPTYSKCLKHQIKTKTGFCIPKELSVKIESPVDINANFKKYTLNDIARMYFDTKKSKSEKRKSVFSSAATSSKLQDLIKIFPKLNKTIKQVEKAPPVPENYQKNITKYFKLLEKEQEKRLRSGQEPQNEQTDAEQSTKIILYSQSVIDDARRIYKMTEKGSGGKGDPFGYYYYGPDNDPFDKSIKIPESLQKDIINRLGGQKRTDEIIQIYGANASASSAINKADQDYAESVHLALDVVGMSPDPLGIGLMADLLNGILYLSRDKYLDAAFSFAGLTLFGDALKIQRGPLRVFFRSLRNIRKGAIYFVDAALSKTLIRWLGGLQRLVFPRLKKLVTLFKSKGIGSLPGGGSVSELEKGIEGAEKLIGSTKTFVIRMSELSSKLSDKISWMYTGRLNTAMFRKLIIEDLDLAKKILTNIVEQSPKIKEFLFEGDLLETIIKNNAEAFKDIGIDIAKKEGDVLIDYIEANSKKIREKAIEIIVENVTKNKAALETFLEDIFEQVQIIELDKRVVKILKERFEEDLAKEFNLKATKGIKEAIDAIVEGLKDPEILKRIEKDVFKVLGEVLETSLTKNKAVENATEQFFKRTYRKALVAVAPGALRKIASFFTTIGTFAYNTVGKMVAKNILGLDGLFGEMYKAAAKRMKQLWDLDAFKIVTKPGNLGVLGRLGFRLGKLSLMWVTSLPFFVLGKLNIFAIYYTRYYRHYCGNYDDFKKQIADKAFKDLLKTWLAVGKYAVEIPFTITAAALENVTGGEIGKGANKKIENAINQGMNYINKILNSKSSQSWYEELYVYLGVLASAPFKCKKRDAIISSSPGFMRGEVIKEINKMEKQLKKTTLDKIRKKAKVYNTAYQKMLDSVNNDDISLPEFAIMSQQQIGAMTPVEQIVGMSLAPSPAKIAANVAREEARNPNRTPEQRQQASSVADEFEGTRYEESKNKESLSDYREKLLEERLEKLTIGLIK